MYYATVPGAGGNDAFFILGNKDNLHASIQMDFCDKISDASLAVLPVHLLNSDALVVIVNS